MNRFRNEKRKTIDLNLGGGFLLFDLVHHCINLIDEPVHCEVIGGQSLHLQADVSKKVGLHDKPCLLIILLFRVRLSKAIVTNGTTIG
ncbi:hypothetical protein CEXT_480821 [Caerostris extrusa]|uniref:Uncharacterized protein n=1 Tax=Caerostris extrusa TaxID=172846 RepID=A0AAV4VZ06_CAEEX|nr:hypothetical protein CEXT_480821 [Caerostris extrusa]